MDKEQLKKLARNPNHIIGIYNYCDRWCERCTFTSRCLNYAMEQEDPLKDDPEANDLSNKKFWNRISDSFKLTREMLKEDAERFGIDIDNLPDDPELNKKLDERHENARSHPVTKLADNYLIRVHEWMKTSKPLFEKKTDELRQKLLLQLKGDHPANDADIISDAVEIIQWYFMQIEVKIARAFSSRYMDEVEGWDDGDAPKDSDGSAKVSLIGIDRSLASWGILLQHFPEEENTILDMLAHLEKLRKSVEKEFPDARSFKRPGFDD